MDRARVLVVDDSVEVCELFQFILGGEGYEVCTAGDGKAGFEMARHWRPDLMIVDVVMPEMDGLELLLKLRSDLVPPPPRVILCSGFDIAEEEALRRGAARFLRKPVANEHLLAAIAEVLQRTPQWPDTERRQREHAAAARRRVLDTARALVERMERHGLTSMATLSALANAKIETLAAYLGVAGGATAIVRDEHLVVLAATEASSLREGFDLGAALPEALEVLETGSALILPDASAHPFAAVSRALGGIRFFAGVPLVVGDGAPVGVICLFDASPRHITLDELAPLQLVGRRGSDVLVRFAELGDATRVVRPGVGIVDRPLLEEMLDAELRVLDRRGGSMELAVIDGTGIGHVSAAVTGAADRERLIGGIVDGERMALYKRATDDSAGATLARVVDELRRGGAGPVGIVELLGGGMRGLGACDLLRAAGVALDRAVAHGDATRRLVVEERVG